jgi:hypothetical protein
VGLLAAALPPLAMLERGEHGMRLSNTSAALAIGALLAGLPAVVSADTLVVPTGMNLENEDAPQSSPFPFATYSPTATNFPFRYQQVYDASYFTSFADVLAITELRFRIDSGFGDRDPYSVPEIQVYLSTTAAEPNALATGSTAAMDGNVGADETLVFSGQLNWDPCGALACPVPQVPPFDQTIPLATTFSYDPAAGNLLLDVDYLGTAYNDQRYDAVNTGDLMSNVREVILRSDGTTHSFPVADSFGLVTQFVFTVPEPGANAVAGAAFAALVALRRSRA